MKRSILLIAAVIFCLNAIAIAQKPRTAMYRYQSKAGDQAIAAGERRKEFIDSPSWKQVGQVGYAHTQKAPGTTPLLEIKRPVKGGNRYFYTIDYQEANAVMKAGNQWKISDYNQGQSCYVSATKKPGTIPVYLYSQPTTGLNYLYIFGDKENNAFKSVAQKSGINFEKIAFYVWEKPIDGMAEAEHNKEPEQKAPTPLGGTSDLAFREAVYFDGAVPGKVNTSAKYAAANGQITLRKSEAVSCAGELCRFNLGVILYRKNVTFPQNLTAVVRVRGSQTEVVNQRVNFRALETTKEVVMSLALKPGENIVSVFADPLNQVSESDETNNRFIVSVTIDP